VPGIVTATLALRTRSAVIDGEVVVARNDGVTDFDALRSALARRSGGSPTVFLYAFDLILDGHDMRRQPGATPIPDFASRHPGYGQCLDRVRLALATGWP
jgi:hypothetical protein